jgi:hypothetical protein
LTNLIPARISARQAAALLLLAGGIAIYLVTFPGTMEWDSFVQLWEGRRGVYHNWHPPVMSWLLGISDALPGPPQAWYTAFVMTIGFGALAAVALLRRTLSWAAVVVAALLLLLPQFLLHQPTVWKDVLFADAALAGFVCLAHVGGAWGHPRWRFGLIAAAAGFLALAALTRQNGILVALPAAIGLGVVAARRGQRGALYGAGLLVAVAGLSFAANAALQTRADGFNAEREQIKTLQLYDITGMVARDPQLALPVLEAEAPRLAAMIRSEGVARWVPGSNDTLVGYKPLEKALDTATPATMTRQWRALIADHPDSYLAVRWEMFRWLVMTPDADACALFLVGEDGDAADLKRLGLPLRMDRRDVALMRYGNFFVSNTPLLSHLFYAGLGFGVLVLLLRRRRDGDVVLAAMIASAWLVTASFLVVAIASDYRYLAVVDLTALAGALHIAGDWRGYLRKRGPEGPL